MSTKKIDHTIFKAPIHLESQNFIDIEFINFELPQLQEKEFAVFTSQNAVKSLFTTYPSVNFSHQRVICVGEKTKQLLEEEFGVTVQHADVSSKRLGEWLVNQNEVKSVMFFCGDIRRGELKQISQEHHFDYKEIITYRTLLTPHQISQPQDGIIFLSPSAVKSFVKLNVMPKAIAFCIGETTASEARKHFDSVKISAQLSVQGVINHVKTYYGIK